MWWSATKACAPFSPRRWGTARLHRRSRAVGIWRRQWSTRLHSGRMIAGGTASFDLGEDLPLRAHLFVLGARGHVLHCWAPSHRGDGWSMSPLWRDLAVAYAARVVGQARLVCGVSGSICGLHAVAAPSAWRRERPGQRHCPSAGVLDRDAQGSSRADRAAHRPAAAGGCQLSRRQRPICRCR